MEFRESTSNRPGWYTEWYDGDLISILIREEITIFGMVSMDKLKEYIAGLNSEYFNSDTTISFYLSDKDNWTIPVFRRPRELSIMLERATKCQQMVLDDIDLFVAGETRYQRAGDRYRRGYLLYGPTGCGKSTIIEMTAIKYNKPVYIINLNAAEMTDATLEKCSRLKSRWVVLVLLKKLRNNSILFK